MLQIVVLVVFAAYAVYSDLRHNKIYNWMNLSLLLTGILVNVIQLGFFVGFFVSIIGVVVGIVLFLPFYLAKGMSAGDVKYMGACGAVVGWPGALSAVGLTLILGTVVAILYVLARNGVKGVTERLYTIYVSALQLIARLRLKDTIMPRLEKDAQGAQLSAEDSFPYAVAIGLGSVAAQWAQMR